MTDQTKKQNMGKAPVYQGVLMYFPRALKAIAFVSKYGKEKYKVDWTTQGWRDVSQGDLKDAEVRHILDEVIEGPINYGDGHLLHAAQAAWEALAVLELECVKREQQLGVAPGVDHRGTAPIVQAAKEYADAAVHQERLGLVPGSSGSGARTVQIQPTDPPIIVGVDPASGNSYAIRYRPEDIIQFDEPSEILEALWEGNPDELRERGDAAAQRPARRAGPPTPRVPTSSNEVDPAGSGDGKLERAVGKAGRNMDPRAWTEENADDTE